MRVRDIMTRSVVTTRPTISVKDAAVADALRQLIALPDPVGDVVRGSRLPNGLQLRQVRVPLGVVGIVYEARPNVTVDAAGLCVKSGNAALLRGSASAYRTNAALVGVLTEADVVRRRIPLDPRQGPWQGNHAGPPPPLTVGEVMSSPPLTTKPDTDAAELARTMIDRGVRSVPVGDDDRLVGIITRRDLVRTLARDDALIAADVRKGLECYGAPDRWTVHVEQGSVTITDQYADPAEHHVALVLAQAVPGVVHAEVEQATSHPA